MSSTRSWIVAAAFIACATPVAGDDEEPPITISLNGVEWTTSLASTSVMPGQSVRVDVQDPQGRRWRCIGPDGEITRIASRRWTWRAPSRPGVVKAHLSADGADEAKAEVKLFVMVPASRVTRAGRLNGYRIGSYPSKPLNGNPLYLPPPGFIEVTEDNEDEQISPRFRLRQFTSKQSGDFPKYIVIDPRLVARLERLASKLEAMDLPSKLHVMSGYRTPFYNRVLGNVQYSLHQWGVAADVFVDEDEDGMMDDLNKDRQIDRGDAATLFKVADALDRARPDTGAFAGGLGVYGGTRAHGPFVHIDVRGRAARW